MNIGLVWPKSTFLIEPMYYPPLGLFYVWEALDHAGHNVHYRDLAEDQLPSGEYYDQVWVSGTSPQASELRRIGLQLQASGIKSVLGGPHAWLKGAEMLPYYDLVVKGEAYTLGAVEQIIDATGYLELPLADPRDIPIPMRDAAWRYKATLRGRPCTTMITSFGCPYKCAFCSSPDMWGKRVRYIPLDTIESDIDVIVSLGFGAIQIYDDILPIKKDRATAIATTLAQRDLIWRCFMRSDLGVKHGQVFLQGLADRGLVEILVGVESACDRIKQNVHKGTTQKQDTILRQWCAEVGISYKASIILGLPGETQETMEETRGWLLANRPDKADINVLIPMPGTPLFDHADEYDCHWVEQIPEEFFFKGKPGELGCLVETDALAPQAILDFRNELVAELALPY